MKKLANLLFFFIKVGSTLLWGNSKKRFIFSYLKREISVIWEHVYKKLNHNVASSVWFIRLRYWLFEFSENITFDEIKYFLRHICIRKRFNANQAASYNLNYLLKDFLPTNCRYMTPLSKQRLISQLPK